MVDVGQIFGRDVEAAAARLPILAEVGAIWLEEPFHTSALHAYADLSQKSPIKLAGGEGAHNFYMAQHLIDFGRVGFIQIDTGRIGGIGPAKKVADYALSKGVTFVNHTFTSRLALSASFEPYAGLRAHEICEYPFSPKPLARELTSNALYRDGDGRIAVPDLPGLGIEVNLDTVQRYLVEVEIEVKNRILFSSRLQKA